MNISIFGTGYVGLVSGACFANVGHNVICVDVDKTRIENLSNGIIPIWEKGLDSLVLKNLNEGRLTFTTDVNMAVDQSTVMIIAVGTPSNEDGSADMQYVISVAESIAVHMTDYKAIVTKSTVPVGTADKLMSIVSSIINRKSKESVVQPYATFDVISNPEFLKEGDAINDFLKPDRIIIGTSSEQAKVIMQEIYEPFNRNRERTIFMDLRSAELTKYAANAMLATKISFMNEMANLAEQLGANIEEVRKGIGADPRIGYQFIYPGCGYGGSCFPKDVQALAKIASQVNYDAKLLKAVDEVNNFQKASLFTKMVKHFGGAEKLKGKTIAIWGLAFKPNTDDMREAPSRKLIDELLQIGATVQAFDPAAMKQAERIYGENSQFKLFVDKYETLNKADVLVICTEWHDFRAPNFVEMAHRMSSKVIIDGRNIYQPVKLSKLGWTYISIGRKSI